MKKSEKLDRAERVLMEIRFTTRDFKAFGEKPESWLSPERQAHYQTCRLRAIERYKKIFNTILEQTKF